MAAIAFTLVASLSVSAAPSPPRATSQVPDLLVEPATYNERALDASSFFVPPPFGTIDYWTVRALRQDAVDSKSPVLFVNGTWVGVVVPDPTWNGMVTYRLEACAVSGRDSSCAASNAFTISVDEGMPPSQPPSPPPEQAPHLTRLDGQESVTFFLAFPGGTSPTAPTRWILDGDLRGTGERVEFSGLPPGPHHVVAVYTTTGGTWVITQDFESSPSPQESLPLLWVLLCVASAAAVGVLVSSRVRGPLTYALVGTVMPRVQRESLLDHFNRGALYQVIKENPGIRFSDLRRRVGIAHGTAIHHLRELERASIVRVVRAGVYTTYTVTGIRLEPESYGLTDSDRAVLSIVRASPGISLSEISKRNRKSLASTSRVVTRLVALGYVTTELSRRRRHVFPREADAAAGLPDPAQVFSVD